MNGMGVIDMGMVDMRVVDTRVTVAGVVELVVVGLVVGVVAKDYLREVKVVDEDYLMKVEVVRRVFVGRSNPLWCVPSARFSIIKLEGDFLEFLDHNIHS